MLKDHILVWKNCLNIIRKSIDSQPYKTWFEPIRPIKLSGEILTIQVPNKFFYEWLEEHYVDVLRKAIKGELGTNGNLEYQIMVEDHRDIQARAKTSSTPKGAQEDNLVINPFVIPGIKKVRIDNQLNPAYTFDNFVNGECNRFPGSAGMAIAKRPAGTAFNPLVIYGDVGLGKTHLSQAIGNEIMTNFADKQVLYITTEKFTNQVIQAIKNSSVNDFMHFYQMIDVLIVDDIQFLSGRSKTQEIFF